jgi:transcriptional regulator with XRE-family HTH domain
MGAAGVSFRELSRRTGLAPAYLNQLANGRRQPSDRALEKIAAALELQPDAFFEWRRRRALEELERRPDVVDRVYAASRARL